MSNYRILEKKGEREYNTCEHVIGCNREDTTIAYIPRFIVQKIRHGIKTYRHASGVYSFTVDSYIDVKELTSLEAAREYKYSLELNDGIVRE